MAQYSGTDPHQSATVWLDRAFGMGGNVREVILGYDCPEHATLFDAMVHEGGTSVRKKAICVFERDRGTPLSRHTGSSKDEMGAIKGYELVVRSISTVGNYDYLVSTVWHKGKSAQMTDGGSSTISSSLMVQLRSEYLHLGTCKADSGMKVKIRMAINCNCSPWALYTITSSIVSRVQLRDLECQKLIFDSQSRF